MHSLPGLIVGAAVVELLSIVMAVAGVLGKSVAMAGAVRKGLHWASPEVAARADGEGGEDGGTQIDRA